jgi:hypothetical protein
MGTSKPVLTNPSGKPIGGEGDKSKENLLARDNGAEKALMQATPQGASNLGIISRALQLLSMSQLRQLLRDCSLPTSGNKHDVIQKIMIYLQTFGPKQPNIVIQFSLKLKALLNIDELQQQEVKRSPVSNDLKDLLFKESPSILFEPTEAQPLLYPIVIEPVLPSKLIQIGKTGDKSLIPVFQIVPESPDQQLKMVTTQINGKFIQFNSPIFWRSIPELEIRSGVFQILFVEPRVKIVATVRLMKRVPVEAVAEKICAMDPAPVITPERPLRGVCPLSRKISITPARSVHCKHAECFDLTYFLSHAFRTNNWICPICYTQITAEDFRVDCEYYKNVASGPIN